MFISIDGVNCERTDYPIEMFQTRFVAEGAHRFIAKVEVLPGPLPIRKVGTIPEIEAMLVASHIYRITAEKRGGQVEIRLWDETEGTDQRTLVKEFRFGEGKS
jgi:hypothetical protein